MASSANRASAVCNSTQTDAQPMESWCDHVKDAGTSQVKKTRALFQLTNFAETPSRKRWQPSKSSTTGDRTGATLVFGKATTWHWSRSMKTTRLFPTTKTDYRPFDKAIHLAKFCSALIFRFGRFSKIDLNNAISSEIQSIQQDSSSSSSGYRPIRR